MESKEKAKTQIIGLELPANNLGRIKTVNLNANRQWNADKQASEFKGCWVKGNDNALYEVNISLTIDVDTLQIISIKPYLRRVEVEGQNQ
jgi:hypothetical protein